MSLRMVAELESIDSCNAFEPTGSCVRVNISTIKFKNSVLPLRNHDVTSFLFISTLMHRLLTYDSIIHLNLNMSTQKTKKISTLFVRVLKIHLKT